MEEDAVGVVVVLDEDDPGVGGGDLERIACFVFSIASFSFLRTCSFFLCFSCFKNSRI